MRTQFDVSQDRLKVSDLSKKSELVELEKVNLRKKIDRLTTELGKEIHALNEADPVGYILVDNKIYPLASDVTQDIPNHAQIISVAQSGFLRFLDIQGKLHEGDFRERIGDMWWFPSKEEAEEFLNNPQRWSQSQKEKQQGALEAIKRRQQEEEKKEAEDSRQELAEITALRPKLDKTVALCKEIFSTEEIIFDEKQEKKILYGDNDEIDQINKRFRSIDPTFFLEKNMGSLVLNVSSKFQYEVKALVYSYPEYPFGFLERKLIRK